MSGGISQWKFMLRSHILPENWSEKQVRLGWSPEKNDHPVCYMREAGNVS